MVCIDPWIRLDCFNCLYRHDVWIGSWKTFDILDWHYFMDRAGLFALFRLLVCSNWCIVLIGWIVLIGFLSSLIVLIVWIVSAGLCFGLLEGLPCGTNRFGCICGILFDCVCFPREPMWSMWTAFWASGAPLGSTRQYGTGPTGCSRAAKMPRVTPNEMCCKCVTL